MSNFTKTILKFSFLFLLLSYGQLFAKNIGTLTVSAGVDQNLVLPSNATTITAAAVSSDGTITNYSWSKISGPTVYSVVNENSSTVTVYNLIEGTYSFEIFVSDDVSNVARDTVNVTVSSRILIDFGPTLSTSPDINGNYWNNISTVATGNRLSSAVTTGNVLTNVGLEVVERIDGTFNTSGPGVNTGNTIGTVSDYINNATTDYAFAHPSATNGQWMIDGLDTNSTYSIKFWGTKSASDNRFIEIKTTDETTWQSYNALNNADYNNAAVFNFTGKSQVIFDIRVPSGSSFGHISLIDITKTANPLTTNIPPVANAGNNQTLTLPTNQTQISGINSTDADGTIISYSWRKVGGPQQYTIISPNSATTFVTNLVEGEYKFELTVTDDQGAIDVDTVNVQVGFRILIDFGRASSTTASPDLDGRYWNNVTSGTEGIKVSDAINTENSNTGISMEIVNRIDGTFNPAGLGVNNGNTVGNVGDYPASATEDYAFADPSATNGSWKIAGLDAEKVYTVKFWGTKTTTQPRIIEIKRADESNWQSYDATNNSNFDNAAIFTFTGKTEMSFDIRVQTASFFGYISVMDINYSATCLPTTSSTDITNCDSYTWNGTTYTESGTYTYITTNAYGCDSTATLNLIINKSTSSTEDITACTSYNWNGTDYTSSGTYNFYTTNSNGCDSVATLNLTINNTTSSIESITACSSLTWNGTIYTSSGTYAFLTTNSTGCDSLAVLILTINQPSSSSEEITACTTYNWNGNDYTSSGTYTFTTTNAVGCDSVVTLNLTINQPSSSSEDITACTTYNWNGNDYTSSGTYTFTTTNAAGCDSVATLNLTINQPSSSSEDITACTTYNWNGNDYTTSGTYTFTTTNAAGCDSVVTLNLTINQPSISSEDITACTTYNWNGNDYTTSGTYTFTTTNAAGCDSVVTLNLTINQPSSSSEDITACTTYNWNGNDYTSSGTYTFTTTNAAGCDSVATLNLTINTLDLLDAGADQTITAGDVAVLNGTTSSLSSSVIWTGGNGTFNPDNSTLTTSYSPSAEEISAGQVTLYLFSNGDCGIAIDSMTIYITPLVPVSMLSLSGTREINRNKLTWKTLNEMNNHGFELQRSLDGLNFTTIDFVNTLANNGNSVSELTYQYIDKNISGIIQYYRLLQIDNNNRSKLSNVISIKSDMLPKVELISIYPNPAISKVNLTISAPDQQNSTVAIYDASGKNVIMQAITLLKGSNIISLNVLKLSSGTYTIKLICTDNCTTAVGQFIKQ